MLRLFCVRLSDVLNHSASESHTTQLPYWQNLNQNLLTVLEFDSVE